MVPPINVEMTPGAALTNSEKNEAVMTYSPTRPVSESPVQLGADSPPTSLLKEREPVVSAEEGDPSNYYRSGEEGPVRLQKQSYLIKVNEQLAAQGYGQNEK